MLCRDSQGIRPAVWGHRGGAYMVASESVALDALGYEFGAEAAPGEIIFNEVMSDPLAEPSVVGQWIELRNIGSNTAELFGCTLLNTTVSPHVLWGSLVIAPGEIVVLAAGGTEFKVIFETKTNETPIQSSIAVANGRLFIRTAKNLHCIGK